MWEVGQRGGDVSTTHQNSMAYIYYSYRLAVTLRLSLLSHSNNIITALLKEKSNIQTGRITNKEKNALNFKNDFCGFSL